MDLKEEMIDIESIQIALDDKLHKYQAVLTNLESRIVKLKKLLINNNDDWSV